MSTPSGKTFSNTSSFLLTILEFPDINLGVETIVPFSSKYILTSNMSLNSLPSSNRIKEPLDIFAG